MSLILASGSPRRRELMALITQDYTVITSDVDESEITADTPAHLAQSLATAKAEAVAAAHPADTVCGFDTVVECDGAVFGKPRDEADALRMLRALSGRSHKVHTGVCVCRGGRKLACAESGKPTCCAMCARPNPTTRRAATPFRDTPRCGVPA